MITKRFRIALALLALGTQASFQISAGQSVKPKAKPEPMPMSLQKTYLPAFAQIFPWSGESLFSCKAVIAARNNTSAVIPAGTMIVWSLESAFGKESHGSFVLEEPLQSGAAIRIATVLGVLCSKTVAHPPKAYYIPKAMPPVR